MKNSFQGYVGVIDSGVGGLTILHELQRDNPFCNYLYLADSAYCPYGTRPPRQIMLRAQTLVRYLQDNGAQAVVIACNTASVYADMLRQQFELPIYDVITPTCKRVISATASKRVALLATNATVNSGIYQRKLAASGITVQAFRCSQLVPLVEQNKRDTAECDRVVARALCNLPQCNADTVILGCTHFPFLRSKIAPYANGANIIECCTDFQPSIMLDNKGETVFLTTGISQQANNAAKLFGDVDFVHVDI